MKQGYKHRSEDFKRRILARVYTNKKDLLEEEYKRLSKINDYELGKKYYNLHNHHFNHWSTNETLKMTVGEKISKANKGNPRRSEWMKNRIISEETKEKLRKINLGKKHTEETRIKMSESAKKRYNK